MRYQSGFLTIALTTMMCSLSFAGNGDTGSAVLADKLTGAVLSTTLPGYYADSKDAKTIVCEDKESHETRKQGQYPCFGQGGSPYFKFNVIRGTFDFIAQDLRPENYVWSGTEAIINRQNGRVELIAYVSGTVGLADKNGGFSICKGEEATYGGEYFNSLKADGKFNIENMRAVALKSAVTACKDAGGVLIKDANGNAKITQESNEMNLRTRSLGGGMKMLIPTPRSCLTAQVQVACDISNRFGELSQVYRNFVSEYPTHPEASNPKLQLLK